MMIRFIGAMIFDCERRDEMAYKVSRDEDDRDYGQDEEYVRDRGVKCILTLQFA